VALDKGGCRCTDAYNEVGRLISEERAKVRNEGYFRVFVAGTSRHKRVISDVELPRRLPLQLTPNGLCIFAPGPEIPAKGMEKHYPLGVSRGGAPASEQRRQGEEQPYKTANTTLPGKQAGLLHCTPQIGRWGPHE